MLELTPRQQELVDKLLGDFDGDVQDLLGREGLLGAISKRAIEAALEGELTHHPGYPPHAVSGRNSGNSRNGYAKKQIKSEAGAFEVDAPRDRNGSFEPQIAKKQQRRMGGLDEKIIHLYAQGQSTRSIQETLRQLYGADVSSSLVSEATASVLEDARAWQSRALDKVYAIAYFDALFVKSREEGTAKTRAVYAGLAIDLDGEKQILGLWIAPAEGAVSWLNIFGELRARGMQDCFIACVDGLRGLLETMEATFSQTRVQSCISSARACAAPTEAAGLAALDAFEDAWGEKYPAIAPLWRKDWARLSTFYDYPPAIRKVIYTTNSVESLNYSLRRTIKNKGAFPNDEAIFKLLCLALREASKKWKQPIRDWKSALNQFVILYRDRMPEEP